MPPIVPRFLSLSLFVQKKALLAKWNGGMVRSLRVEHEPDPWRSLGSGNFCGKEVVNASRLKSVATFKKRTSSPLYNGSSNRNIPRCPEVTTF